MELNYKLKQVLSPKRYLSQSQQHLPRQDQRKHQLSLQIQQALRSSRNYQEFEQVMKDKGYQVIKGRGISFVDDKKVKIKGSEVNFYLQTIERILGQQKSFNLKQSVTDSGISDSSTSPSWRSGIFSSDSHSSNDLSKDLSRIADLLMKPTQTSGSPDDTGPQQKFKKKRKRSNHL